MHFCACCVMTIRSAKFPFASPLCGEPGSESEALLPQEKAAQVQPRGRDVSAACWRRGAGDRGVSWWPAAAGGLRRLLRWQRAETPADATHPLLASRLSSMDAVVLWARRWSRGRLGRFPVRWRRPGGRPATQSATRVKLRRFWLRVAGSPNHFVDCTCAPVSSSHQLRFLEAEEGI